MYVMYLRKSRADNPDESVEEVLAKHETILQEFCKRELGYAIPEEDIYREVVSGESIKDRFEIKKVLSRIEDSKIKGIIVIEPQRLSRGDLVDCGNLINTLQFTKTLVVTPTLTYNIENKMERRFFQDELMRGRDYLEYTKEILLRGKVASVKRGNFIGSYAPYGYDRVTIGGNPTLAPNKDADVVRMIFEWYVNDWSTPYEISKRLNSLGIPSAKNALWDRNVIRRMLRNPHYAGKVMYFYRKEKYVMRDGEKVMTRPANDLNDEEVVIAEGRHQAIISQEMFDKAQQRFASHPKVKGDRELRNFLAGMIFCKKCGKAMRLKGGYGWPESRYTCILGCVKGIKDSELIDTIIKSLEQSELPNLETKLKNGEGGSQEIKRKLVKRLEEQMEEYKSQEEMQYELLETRKYTQELFDKRNKALREKIDKCFAQLDEARKNLPDAIDYGERIATLKEAIASLNDDSISAKDKNKLLKAIVDRIDYDSERGQKTGINEFSLDIKLLL